MQNNNNTPAVSEDEIARLNIYDALNNWANEKCRETIPRKSFMDVAKYILNSYNTKPDGLSKIKEMLIDNLTKNEQTVDNKFITSGQKSYTKKQLAEEIKNDTPFGLETVSNVINLTLDILSRGKANTKPESKESDAVEMISIEEYNNAINEIGHLQKQLKEAEDEIRDLSQQNKY